MPNDLTKAYEPNAVEAKWYPIWEDAGAFKANLTQLEAGAQANTQAPLPEPFSIVIPPPNVTGVLHMGHILNNTIQDILTRRARQQGKAAVWVPGTDHAGIATQTKVEKELRKQGKTKWDLGRKAFNHEVQRWRDQHGGIILKQLRKLGCSCDWERTVHTLDTATQKAHVEPSTENAAIDYHRAVLTAFVELFNKGHIYRGKRMVNWCPKSLTALSDEEVIMKPQKGTFFKMQYEVVERPGEFVQISTTRPETIMGDTAVAIHPEDPRYTHLHGCHVWRPFPRAKIPFVLDEHVDREFGTGVLKVTPAHDRADFEIGERHQLEVIDILTPEGKVNCPEVPQLHGLDRFAARKQAGELLETLGLLIEREKYENNVGFSERADVPIEPRLCDQWWLRYPKVQEAREAVCPTDGSEPKIKFYPQRWTKTYAHWLENIQDWCISRQLWWGHRIPVWYRKGIDRNALSEADLRDPQKVFVGVDGPADPENWEQEEDVLDTWASSWLWPFGVFGWPGGGDQAQPTLDLKHFYPTQVLATGPDIIFFWVARMIMAGLEFMGDVPFKHVVFNGIIRDTQGRKMSKSLGNSPDPLDLIDKFGADGLRLGMLMMAPKGSDILFSEDRVQLGRNFCNKLWNACRFRLMQAGEAAETGSQSLFRILLTLKPAQWDADDHAIIAKLVATLEATEQAYAAFEFNRLTDAIYKFFWTDYCDWYVEVSKAKLQSDQQRTGTVAILDLCLRCVIQMLAPVTPFICEELWQTMGYGKGLLQDAGLVTAAGLSKELEAAGIVLDAEAIREVEDLQGFVVKARALKAQYQLSAKADVGLHVVASAEQAQCLMDNLPKLKKLVGFSELLAAQQPEAMPSEITPLGTVYLDLAGSVDVEAEVQKLDKQIEQLDKAIKAARSKLGNENFTGRAPATVIEGVRQTLADNEQKRAEVLKLREGLRQ
jgi:valyl-tRNA synthetase